MSGFVQAAVVKVALSAATLFATVAFAAMAAVENATAFSHAVDNVVSERMAL